MKQKKKKGIAEVHKVKRKPESLIWSGLKKTTDAVYHKAAISAVGSALTRQEDIKATENSLILGAVADSFNKKKIKAVKHGIQQRVESSVLLGRFSRLVNTLLCANIHQYGLFVFALGMYTTVMYLLGNYVFSFISAAPAAIVIGAVEILISVPMLLSKRTLSQGLCESDIAGFLLFDLMGLPEESVARIRDEGGSNSIVPFVCGILAGLATTVISPLDILLYLLVAVLLCIVMTSPESGMVLLVFGMSFLHADIILAGLYYVLFCYIFKVIRGKRVFNAELIDLSVISLAAIMLFGSFFSVDSSVSFNYVYSMLGYMSAYILIVNLIKNKEWCRRIVGGIVFSLIFSVTLGLIQRFILDADFIISEGLIIGGTVKANFAAPEILAQFILITVFYLFGTALSNEEGIIRKLFVLISCIAAVVCLYYTSSVWAMLCCVLAAVIFFLIYSKRTVIFLACAALLVPFARSLLPVVFTNKISEIFASGIDSITEMASAWAFSLRMAFDHMFFGSGSGTYNLLYSRYAQESIDSIPPTPSFYSGLLVEIGAVGVLFLLVLVAVFVQRSFSMFAKHGGANKSVFAAAGFAGIFGTMLLGVSENIWQEPMLVFTFWVVMGLTIAIKRCADFDVRGYDDIIMGG